MARSTDSPAMLGRMSLPKDELDLIRNYVAAGKPVIGIRTASHAFHLRNHTRSAWARRLA